MSGWRISSGLRDRLLAEAAAAPDREVCGLLFGAAGRIEAARACPNVAADPARAFEIDPATLLAAHRAERAGRARIVGHYHSHPQGAPVPSPRDAAAADEAGRLWLILGDGAARLWRAVPGGPVHGAFVAVNLVAG